MAAMTGSMVPVADAASLSRQLAAIYQPLRVEHAALAPDGRHVAFLVRDGREMRVAIYDVGRGDPMARVLLPWVGTAKAGFFSWVGATHVVVVAQDGTIIAIEVASGTSKQLVKAGELTGREPGGMMRVLRLTREEGGVLIEAKRADFSEVKVDIVRVDVRTGERVVLHSQALADRDDELLTDRDGRPRVRFARSVRPMTFQYLPIDGRRRDWRPLDRVVDDPAMAQFHVTPENFAGERSLPLGFGDDPGLLYFASNVGRDHYGVYTLALQSGRLGEFSLEDPLFDLADLHAPFAESQLVFDRASGVLAGLKSRGADGTTRWVDGEIGGVQAALDEKFPGRRVGIVEWDGARERFLVLVASAGDEGRYFVFHRRDGRSVEYFRRSLLHAAEMNRTDGFAFETAEGVRVSGFLAWPRTPPLKKPALIVWFHDGPWEHVGPEFQRDAQALAAMGFAVAQINYRGSSGLGRRHADAIREGFDRVPVEDARAAIAWLAARHDFDRRRVVAAGEGFGGYLALRALQLAPEFFRCGAAFNAPLDLRQLQRNDRQEEQQRRAMERDANVTTQGVTEAMTAGGVMEFDEVIRRAGRLEGQAMAKGGEQALRRAPVPFDQELARAYFGRAHLAGSAVTAHPGLLAQPVLLLHDPNNPRVPIGPARALRDELRRRKQPVELRELPASFGRGDAAARAAAFRAVAEFLNENLYEFDVTLGELVEQRERE